MSRREKTLLLGGVVLILCSLTLSEWLQPTDTPSSDSPLQVEESMNHPPFPQSALTLNLADSKHSVTLKNPRNIFAPLKDPDAPREVQVPPERPSPPSPVQPVPSPVSAQPTGPSPTELAARHAKEEMQQYKFLGYLTKAGIQQGFLGKGQAIYIVKQGERFKDDLEVKSIGPAAVVLSKHVKQAGITVDVTLPLTENGQAAF